MANASSPRNLFVWIILALVMVGLMGFGATGFSGGTQSIATVGSKEVTASDYVQGLRAEIQAMSAARGTRVGIAELRAEGRDGQVLGQLIAERVLDNETARLGVSAGDELVGARILEMPFFQDATGKFDRAAYAYQLEQAGLSEAEFEENLRDETARTLLQQAILGGVPVPETYSAAITAYLLENRDVTWAPLNQEVLPEPLPSPTEDQLATYLQAHQDAFMAPELRRITAAQLLPEMIQDQITLDETALKELYDERANEYQRPERRLVERLVFPDAEAADLAAQAIASGDSDFDAQVAARGLELSDIDMGDVTQQDLGAAGGPVFAAEAGAVVGPVNTSLGPALMRVNAILAASQTSYEEALPELREELSAARARRVIEDRVEGLTDLIAGGASPEDLAERTEMTVTSFDFSAESGDGLAGYTEIREAAQTLSADSLPSLIELEDGGVVSLRLDEVVPARPLSLDEARQAVTDAWTAEALNAALVAQGEALLPQLTDGASFADLGLKPATLTGQTRDAFLTGVPASFVLRMFELNKDEYALVSDANSVALMRLDAVNAGDLESPQALSARAQIDAGVQQRLSGDVLRAISGQVQTQTDIQINQAAINDVNARFQ